MKNIDTLRLHYQKNIRKNHLQQIFSKKRSQIHNFNLKTNNQYQEHPSNEGSLIQQLQNGGKSQKLFIQIGNYILDNQFRSKQFQAYFIPHNQQNLTQNYCWVITLLVFTNKQYSSILDYDQIISQMIKSQNSLILKYGLICFEYLFLNQISCLEKSNCTFLKLLNQVDPDSISIQINSLILKIISYYKDSPQVLPVYGLGNILKKQLKDLLNYRTQVLQFIYYYFKNIVQFSEQTYQMLNSILKQIYFLSTSSNHQNRLLIFETLAIIIQKVSIKQIVFMLNNGLVTHLAEGFFNYYQVSFVCLKAIEILLKKLNENLQKKMIDRILIELQRAGFQCKIQQMYQCPPNQEAKKSICYIIDQFYNQSL